MKRNKGKNKSTDKNKNTVKKEEDEIIFKIITLGDSGVGKTSIIKRYITGEFDDNIASTVGINFSFKELIINESQKIKLKIIDACGQERFKSLSKAYFKNADGVLYVFGVNDKDSFYNIKEWMGYFNENNTLENTPKVLIGNKCDLEFDKELNKNLIEEFSEENKIKYIESSVKDNKNINELFEELGKMLYKKGIPLDKQKSNIIIKTPKKQKKVCILCDNDL